MREIKFRAWDPEAESYRYGGHVQFDGQVVSEWGKDKYDWILEQFTGLRDKNDVEIYEGDIVKAWIDYGPGGEGQHVYAVTISPHGTSLQEWTFREDGYLPEVIGNIHENPELLDK